MTSPTVLVNGRPTDGRIPVTDSSVLRGDGCFEVIRAYRGVPFRLDDHLERLERSAASLDIELPPLDEITSWVTTSAEAIGDGAVRVVVTRGSSVPAIDGESLAIVFAHESATPIGPARLLPVSAPWHAAGARWELAGAKVTSYAPNMAASRSALKQGYDDALLVTVEEVVLEGPTFSVGWVVDGVLETPTLELGILDSITRRVVIELAGELGIPVVESKAQLSRVEEADEVFAFSTVKEVQPVTAVGDAGFDSGPVAAELSAAFRRLTGA
jgi:branched-subunit amino acid aminotransferase/4-amino-4-deoxychorismate lyase